MFGKFLKLIALIVMVFSGSVVCAQNWYIGIGGGTSSYDLPDEVNELDQIADALDDVPGIDASFSADDSDTAVKLFAGINVNPNFALEFGYVDLGEISADFSVVDDGSFTADPSTTIISGTDSVDGFNFGVVGKVPLSDQVSLNGRLGLYLWQLDSQSEIQDTTGLFGNGSESTSDDGEDVYYGVGLDIGWFGLFYELYDVDGDDVDLLGISATYRFD